MLLALSFHLPGKLHRLHPFCHASRELTSFHEEKLLCLLCLFVAVFNVSRLCGLDLGSVHFYGDPCPIVILCTGAVVLYLIFLIFYLENCLGPDLSDDSSVGGLLAKLRSVEDDERRRV